ncbi:carbohydrate-binding protein [Rhizocola hellebori]|uniref:Carbohydrate-binding protein n=2 Tax=Rhizocola hellebori TaxID=1392758 RepID=A0A8J3VKR4_9ACTN|nr:carbohydrate-binding protein [Rhizocola hellebori]
MMAFGSPAYAAAPPPSNARVAAAATFGLESLGGDWANQKTTVIARSGRIDAFLIGRNYQLYHYWQNPGEPFYMEALGGFFQLNSVAAVTSEPGRRDVFIVGRDSQMYHYWQVDVEGFFRSESLGGDWPAGMIEAVSWGPGRFDVFTLGRNNHIYHYWYPHLTPTGAVFGLESLGNYGPSSPILAATTSYGRLDLFVTIGSSVMHFFQNAGQSFYYEYLPMSWWERPGFLDAVSSAPGRLDLFVSTTDTRNLGGLVLHFWQDPGTGWFGKEGIATWTRSNGYATTSPITTVSWGRPRVDFFTKQDVSSDPYNAPMYHAWHEDHPWDIENLGGFWPGHMSAVSWGPRRLDLFTIGGNAQFYHQWQG